MDQDKNMAYDEEGSSSDEDFDSDDYDDYDSSSDGSSLGQEMDVEAERLWDAMHAGGGGGGHPVPPPPMAKSPEQILQDHLTAIVDGSSNVLKLDDSIVQHIVDIGDLESIAAVEIAAATAKQEAILQLYSNVLHAIQNSVIISNESPASNCGTIKHVILGTRVLQLWTPSQQTAIYEALAIRHSATMTYCKLGTNDMDELCGISADQLFSILLSTAWPCLTEFQIRGFPFSLPESIEYAVQFLRSVASTIKLFNIVGMSLSPNLITSSCNGGGGGALWDPLLQALEPIIQLDEVQLHRMVLNGDRKEGMQIPPLVSSQALLHLLQVKPKWWRLTLDGMGLQDAHLEVLGNQLVSSKDCKMNDLLSIRNNPNVSSRALSQLYHICINKQRMGLVLSDDANLIALVDLVRPLNNLHRRLEYKDDQGAFSNVDQWLAWFQVLSNLPWLDETRKLNYIWFTLLEQPSMIATAIHAFSAK